MSKSRKDFDYLDIDDIDWFLEYAIRSRNWCKFALISNVIESDILYHKMYATNYSGAMHASIWF